MDQKSLRLMSVRDTPRQGRGRLKRVGGGGAIACLLFLVGTAAAIAQDGEALRQLEWCKNASRMVSDALSFDLSRTHETIRASHLATSAQSERLTTRADEVGSGEVQGRDMHLLVHRKRGDELQSWVR
jgi:hypothetical protein